MAYQPYHQKRIDAGLCKDCGLQRGNNGTTIYCRSCSSKIQENANARKEAKRKEWAKAGNLICNGCGAHLENAEFKLCEKCRQYHRSYSNKTRSARMERKSETGSCAACSAQAMGKSRYCKKHFLENILCKYGVPTDEYALFWEKLEQQKFLCYYTGTEIIPGINASIDHRLPRSRGGKNDITNCVWCDRNINAFKRDATDEEFINLCKRIAGKFT